MLPNGEDCNHRFVHSDFVALSPRPATVSLYSATSSLYLSDCVAILSDLVAFPSELIR